MTSRKHLFLFLFVAVVLVAVWLLMREGVIKNVDMLMQPPSHEIGTEEVSYAPGVTGYLAYPIDMPDAPGVVVIHEWWGLNDNIKEMARQLAGEGYAALAVDLYGEVAETPERARELSSGINQEEANANLRAAAAYLRDRGAERLASLGWCFGGAQSLQLALSGEDMDGTVIYYGRLTDDAEQLRSIDWPVLGIFGEDDGSIPPEDVRAFESSLQSVGVTNTIYIYPGVGHAFANPSGANYAPEETMDAWEKTTAFLAEVLMN